MSVPNSYTFSNQGFVLSDIPRAVQKELWNEILEIQEGEVDRQSNLPYLTAGLSEAYTMPKAMQSKSFAYFIKGLINEQGNNFSYLNNVRLLNSDVPFCLHQVWVNFQKKGEYVPVHDHSGIFSFVIWCKIPYQLEDEINLFVNKNDNAASQFVFYYTDILGNICNHKLPIDKNWEWKIVFFPSKLSHAVYPFYTSDETRISISGNVFLNTLNLNEEKK